MRSLFRTVGRRFQAGYAALTAARALRRGNGVTLWDEIGPPAPQPAPGDAPPDADTGNSGDTDVIRELAPSATAISP